MAVSLTIQPVEDDDGWKQYEWRVAVTHGSASGTAMTYRSAERKAWKALEILTSFTTEQLQAIVDAARPAPPVEPVVEAPEKLNVFRRPKRSSKRAAKLRALCAIRDGGWWCWYCDEPLVEGANDHRKATLDHVVPLSRGGNWKIRNCRLACEPCNNAKGDRTADEYRKERAA